jgi:ABC-type uncharacterized transport system substrate-binding protein
MAAGSARAAADNAADRPLARCSPVAAAAAKDATMTIPIVFSISEDPIRLGLVDSSARPGGNATGVNFFISELGAKGLGLLRELLPSAERFGALVNPNNPTNEIWTRDVSAAATLVGAQIDVINARDSREIGRAFKTLIQNRTDALLIAPDSVFFNQRIQLATLATRHALPAIYPWREAVEIGGLMSYGTNLPDVYRQLGVYTGRILKGTRPSDLPVVQPTKFELVIT